ncbi:MAG: HK97 family phage prohead protease [Alphaproteobacteria bacterium]
MNNTTKTTPQSFTFSGYASLYNVTDQQKDVVLPGAFTASLHDWQARKRLPSLLWQHDTTQPIGRINRIVDNDKGLLIEGVLFFALKQGFEASTLVKERALDGLSIGFQVVKSTKDPRSGNRLIHEAVLWEVSLVTFPANLKTRIQVV